MTDVILCKSVIKTLICLIFGKGFDDAKHAEHGVQSWWWHMKINTCGNV